MPDADDAGGEAQEEDAEDVVQEEVEDVVQEDTQDDAVQEDVQDEAEAMQDEEVPDGIEGGVMESGQDELGGNDDFGLITEDLTGEAEMPGMESGLIAIDPGEPQEAVKGPDAVVEPDVAAPDAVESGVVESGAGESGAGESETGGADAGSDEIGTDSSGAYLVGIAIGCSDYGCSNGGDCAVYEEEGPMAAQAGSRLGGVGFCGPSKLTKFNPGGACQITRIEQGRSGL